MEHEGTLTLESDWLPPSELSRLVSESSTDFPALSISARGEPAHRGLDPTSGRHYYRHLQHAGAFRDQAGRAHIRP